MGLAHGKAGQRSTAEARRLPPPRPTGEARRANRGLAAGTLLLAIATLALAAMRDHPIFSPFELLNLPAPVWQLGYFDTGRSLLPWLFPLGAAALLAARLRSPARGYARTLLAALVLFTVIPGRPLGLRSMAALLLTLPWALLFVGFALSREGEAWRRRAAALGARLAQLPPALFAAGAGGVAFALAAFAADRLFGRVPHVLDSTVYYFQAKLFAAGQLGLVIPPAFEPFLSHPFLIPANGEQVPMYPPGWPMLLAIGFRLGVPWLAAPALVAASLVLLYLWAREEEGESSARLAVLLGLVSPFFLLMGGETMAHPAALFFFQLSLWSQARAMRGSGACGFAGLSGIAVGLGAATRPLTALGLALPLAAGGALDWSRRAGRRLALPAAWLAGLLIGLAPMAAHNAWTTGSPLVFPVQKHLDGSFRLGFGSGIVGNDHWPEKALANALANFNGLNKLLLEWPIPALAPLLVLALARGPLRPAERTALACTGGLAGVYLFHYYQDLCLGPRYLYEASGLALFLVAAGLARAKRRLAEWPSLGQAGARGAVILVVAGFSAAGGALFVPGVLRTCAADYWATSSALARALEAPGGPGRDALVLVPPDLWNAAFPLEPVDLETGPVLVPAPSNVEAMRAAVPGRQLWTASRDGSSVTLSPLR